MNKKIELPNKIRKIVNDGSIDNESKCRKIISLSANDEYDKQFEASAELANIFDLAIRYLDKEVSNKSQIWEEIIIQINKL